MKQPEIVEQAAGSAMEFALAQSPTGGCVGLTAAAQLGYDSWVT